MSTKILISCALLFQILTSIVILNWPDSKTSNNCNMENGMVKQLLSDCKKWINHELLNSNSPWVQSFQKGNVLKINTTHFCIFCAFHATPPMTKLHIHFKPLSQLFLKLFTKQK